MTAASQVRTLDMPARWLRPGDRLLRGAIVYQVTRVEYTHGEPLAVTLADVSGDLAGRQHAVVTFAADEMVARITGVQTAGVVQGAPAPVLL